MGISYSEPLRITYSFGLINFASPPVAQLVKPGFRTTGGRVNDIHVRVTVLFTQVTTPAFINIGTVATPTKYASLNMGAAAANTSYNQVDGAVTSANIGAVFISDINFSRDAVTTVQFQLVAPTGGTPAGSGYVDITMGWF